MPTGTEPETEIKTEAQIKKAAKDEIIAYAKDKKKNGRPIAELEKRNIEKYLEEKGYSLIERIMGFSKINKDIKAGDKTVEIIEREGFKYYRYMGPTD
jgi:hypothetical protein